MSMFVKHHNHKAIAIALFVTVFMTITLTATAYTFNPSKQGSLPTGDHEPVEPTTTPMPLEPATILSRSHSLRRLQPLPAIEDEPIVPSSVRLQDNRPALRAQFSREYKLLEPILKSMEEAPLRLWEPYKLEARSRSTREVRKGHQDTRPATTCTVTTPADNGAGSLRQCLVDGVLSDTLNFDPQVFPLTTLVTITLSTPLPSIVTDSLTIDGSNAGVVLDGSRLSEGDGFVVNGADGVTIQGLQIFNFPRDGIALIFGASNAVIGGNEPGDGNLISGNNGAGVWLQSVGTTNNQILGNYIGTNASGTASLGNANGIVIVNGAQDNLVGGETAGARNLISGNTNAGIKLAGTTDNQVLGNYIGTDVTGTAPLGNADGIIIRSAAQNNLVGGATEGARNVISGNTRGGIQIQNKGTSGNQILGNYIGTDVSGTAPLSNTAGVVILFAAQENLVGGALKGNLISGNTDAGIQIQNKGTNSNQVLGNYIGTDAAGTTRLGNAKGVIILDGAQDNIVGGETAGARNLISGNTETGIKIKGDGTTDNQVLGNYIGTDVTGTASLDNAKGVFILDGAQNNLVGGETAGARNLISGNTYGIWLQDSGTSGNQVQGNYIGTDTEGTASLGNTYGVVIDDAQNNLVGGETAEARNLMSGNTGAAIWLQGSGTSGNQVRGNYIGTDAEGTTPLGNAKGIIILGGAQDNLVGGETAGARNLISGNTYEGIQVQDSETISNTVQGNYIGTDVTGTAPLGNAKGILILLGAQNNFVGGETVGARNLISGNTYVGIFIQGTETSGNQVLGNYIGTDASGTAPLGNTDGVRIGFDAQNNLVGGETAGARNLISGNTDAGIYIQNSGTISNTVLGNYIGTDVTGTAPLGNADGIIISSAQNNLVGGAAEGARNVISGNTRGGIQIQNKGTSGNQILGNYIGTDVSGTAPLSNTAGVVILFAAQENLVGGNLISGNTDAGIQIQNKGTNRNQVLGNYIGTDAEGTTPLGNAKGVIILDGAQDNIVGGAGLAGNVISGNTKAGIKIKGDGTSHNTVQGNYIGTDVTGTAPLSNTWGVLILDGAQNNLVGGETAGARNLISGNTYAGIQFEGPETSGNQVLGNYIGSDPSGTASLGNANGVLILDGAQNNLVGGETAGARNLISGNTDTGISIADDGTTDNQVLGNYIGTDVTGTAPLGNFDGIIISSAAQNNLVGGAAEGARNVISGNTQVGIFIQDSGTNGNQILGNYIGTDVSGTVPLSNMAGVVIGFGAQENLVGGALKGNLISGNTNVGIQIQNKGTNGNQVLGNYIGTDAEGTTPLGNAKGVTIFDGAQGSIVGSAGLARNVISGNTKAGIKIKGDGTIGNQILGNYIGTDAAGSNLGNDLAGVQLDGASSNTIGFSNTIAYNGSAGVVISGTTTLGNTITRNLIKNNEGPPIDFINVPEPLSLPIFSSYSPSDNLLSGRACDKCRVELFANSTSEPAGTMFLGGIVANAKGTFTTTMIVPPDLPYLSATVTDLDGTTSEFSVGFCTTCPTATATSTPTSTPTATKLYLPVVLH